jgi:LPXTG-site transpeptidase (sortase) family protein
MTANKKVTAQVKALQTLSSNEGGSSETGAPPSTEKVSAAAIRNYAVVPANPRYIDIPKLQVHARILAMTVDEHNELKAPYGIYDAGWYSSSSLPGQNGAMLLDGHSGIGKTHGIFHDIAKLAAGDQITITRGDGQKFTYAVVKTAVMDVAKVDMSSTLVSQDTAKPGLSLITCAGDQIPGTFSLKQRVVVYAVLQ